MNYFLFCKGRLGLWYTLIVAVYLCSCSAIASTAPPFLQQQKISGVITDAVGPLAGVSIAVKGSTVLGISDERGRYTITASIGDSLIFSFTGFKSMEVAVTLNTVLNVVLTEDVTQLEEVVVNAGYYSVKQKESTGSIARITSEEISKQPVTNALATMQGRMAGVNITQTTGVPGGGFEVEIRGQNSLRGDGNRPLYIIDGVPYASDPIGNTYTSSTTPQLTSPLNSINPGDIASIEILKDADATAIYGSRGANGVVLVTTKRGRQGKTSFSASIASGFGQVTRLLSLMGTQQYLAMRREAYANDGITDYPANAYDVNGTWDPNRYTDWQKELIGGTAGFTTVQASLSGGSQHTQFLLSGNYNKETTVFPGSFRYNKANVHLNVNHTSTDEKFKINLTSGYTLQDNLLPPLDFTHEAIKLAPNAPALYDAQGILNWENNTFDNPLASLAGNYQANTYDLIANSVVSYQIIQDLEVKASFGFTDLRHTELQTQPSTIYNPSYGYGSEVSSVLENNTNRSSWIIEPQLHYLHSFGKLGLDALTGATFQNQAGNQVVHQGYGFSSNSLIDDPASASRYTIMGSSQSEYRYQAFFARVNLNWDKRYILNLTGRRDGSSRFGPGKQFASFGAIGAAWLFSNEEWIVKSIPFLSFGKLRASYGTTGNDQIGDYQYLDTYSTSGLNYQGNNGLSPTRLYNPDFGWETNNKLEVALEAGFLKDRLFLTLGWYRNRSASQLVGIPLPGTTGFTEIQANLDATVENRGFELTLHTVNISNGKFSWTTNINFTKSRNELLSFPGLEGSTYKYQYEIGRPLNIARVYHYTGLEAQSGIYQFEDTNSDGSISAADKTKAVDLNPKFYGGLQNQLTWGPVQLDFLFQFVKQRNFNQTSTSMMPGLMVNQPAGAADRWQVSGDNAEYQRYSSGSDYAVQIANTRHAQSDAGISDASYIRLKNVAVSFELPKEWTKKVTCKLTLQAQNMLTITSFKGADPEFKTPGALPPLRMLTTGLQVNF